MKLFRTRIVKKCICGKEAKTTVEWTDWDQVQGFLLTIALATLVIAEIIGLFAGLSLFSLDGVQNPENAYIAWIGIGLFLSYMGYSVYKGVRKGHSLLCALRLAGLKSS